MKKEDIELLALLDASPNIKRREKEISENCRTVLLEKVIFPKEFIIFIYAEIKHSKTKVPVPVSFSELKRVFEEENYHLLF